MFKIIIFVIQMTLCIFTEASYVDSMNKCGIEDSECQRKLYQATLEYIAENGIEDLSIPKVDPIQVHNITVLVAGMIEFTLVDGETLGVKSCFIDHFKSEIEKGLTLLDMECNIKVHGKYRMKSSGGILKSIFGENSIHGEGEGKLEIEKLRFHFVLTYDIKKRDNNNYLISKNDYFTYSYDILGKTTIEADNLYIGSVDVAKPAVAIFNENSDVIMKVFAKSFIDKAMEITYVYTDMFFKKVPAEKYLSGKL